MLLAFAIMALGAWSQGWWHPRVFVDRWNELREWLKGGEE